MMESHLLKHIVIFSPNLVDSYKIQKQAEKLTSPSKVSAFEASFSINHTGSFGVAFSSSVSFSTQIK